MMNTKLSRKDWRFVLQWALFSTYGMMLGLPIAFAVLIIWSFLRGIILHLALSSSVLDLIDALIFASISGAFLGALQSRLLNFQKMHTYWWMAASTAGLSLGAAGIVALQNQSGLEINVSYWMIGAIIGLVLGIAQWFVLRLQVTKSGWWIVGNLIGGILSSTIISPLVVLGNTIEAPWGLVFFLIFFALTVGVIYATSTGILMSRLLTSRVHKLQEAG